MDLHKHDGNERRRQELHQRESNCESHSEG